jgi:hypothetical protein
MNQTPRNLSLTAKVFLQIQKNFTFILFPISFKYVGVPSEEYRLF